MKSTDLFIYIFIVYLFMPPIEVVYGGRQCIFLVCRISSFHSLTAFIYRLSRHLHLLSVRGHYDTKIKETGRTRKKKG